MCVQSGGSVKVQVYRCTGVGSLAAAVQVHLPEYSLRSDTWNGGSVGTTRLTAVGKVSM